MMLLGLAQRLPHFRVSGKAPYRFLDSCLLLSCIAENGVGILPDPNLARHNCNKEAVARAPG